FETEYIGGEVPQFDARVYLGEGNLRPLDRIAQLTASAAQLALADSVWTEDMRSEQDVGIVLGTVFSSVHTIGAFDQIAVRRGPRFVKPLDFANTVINAPTGQTAIWHNLRGINSTLATGAGSGLLAIGYASDLICSGRAAALLAGGAEELSFEMLFGFDRANMLSDSAESAVPFDERRTGLALGEGAAFLMLEAVDQAQARGASILGIIRGYGTAFDPIRGQDADKLQTAMAAAIRAALAHAEMSIEDIHCISASAYGSPMGDRCEANAINDVFGDQTASLPITAIKSALGETLGASGAIQTVALLEHLHQGVLPGICGFKTPEMGLRLPTSSNKNCTTNMKNGLVLSFGHDGNLCALVLSKA
ncbi:MAG: beta-ketoacyl synthase N-terminal-like domain-containing protein, partial [Candidatus Latescibacteria bacterium]|nr:beta-ketoacyl synthase N-terminal-like domain-containing protein [Candidatus Latescibacterota bacterium]